MTCPALKQDIGSSPSPKPDGPPAYQTDANGLEDNWSAPMETTDTGNLWSPSPRRLLYPESATYSDLSTPSVPDRQPPSTTSGRKTPESPTPSLNSESDACSGLPPPTGRGYGTMPLQGTSSVSLPILEYAVIVPSKTFGQIMLDRLHWSEVVQYYGVVQVLVKAEGLLKKPEWMLTIRIHEPSSGAAIAVKRMLFWMNFEEQSTSLISFDGLIGIQSLWSSKAPVHPCYLNGFGSRATSTRTTGTQT